MKRILTALIAATALMTVFASAANAESQQTTCQGPASYCKVFFGN